MAKDSTAEYTEIYKHRFVVTDATITAGSQFYIDPMHIGVIQFEYDYMNRRLPIIKLSVSLTEETMQAIQSNLETAKMALEVLDNAIDGDEVVINSKVLIHDTFDIVPATGADDTTGDITSQYETDPEQAIQLLYLIKRDRVQWLDKEIASIFKNTDKSTAVLALFSMRDIPSKTCVITPPSVNQSIDNLVLPMGDVIGNIDTINTQYGLWSSDAIIFDDYTYLYCIDRNNPNIIINRTSDYDTVMFKVPSNDNTLWIATGSGDDAKNKCHYVNIAYDPSVEDNTATTTQTEFGTLTSVDTNGTVKKYTVDANSPKIKVIRSTNDLSVDQYMSQLANPIIVTLTATDCSLDIFKPYKNYWFDVEETNALYEKLASKIFRLQYLSSTLNKKQDYFEPTVVLRLSVVETPTVSKSY